MRSWGFLTNHAHVLIQVARGPRSTVREIARAADLTERAVHGVLRDLRQAGLVRSRRDGRQNVNQVDPAVLIRHRPWSASDIEIPETLIQATLRGLAEVAGNVSEGFVDQASSREPKVEKTPQNGRARRWGFLTTHACILIHVTQHPHSTVREIALVVGVTERAAHATLQDLRESGIIESQRNGRRNSYTVSFEHLSSFRREGTAPGLVPDAFVASLVDALLPIQPQDYPPLDDEAHPVT